MTPKWRKSDINKNLEISRIEISRSSVWILAYFMQEFRHFLAHFPFNGHRAARFLLISCRIRARSRHAFAMSRNAFQLRSLISSYFMQDQARSQGTLAASVSGYSFTQLEFLRIPAGIQLVSGAVLVHRFSEIACVH